MDKLSKYVLKEFFSKFIVLFMIIAAIVSLIFIIYISNVTAGIKITFTELIKLYFLTLPQIVFIAIPLAFFISANSVYAALSESQELIALFASGFKPLRVLKPIIFTGIVLSVFNLLILFVSIPYSKVSFNNLKAKKQQEAQFNFQSSQISQQFGDWSVFAQKSKHKTYENLYLFNKKENRFIIAKNAELKNIEQFLVFTLKHGQIYDFVNNFKILYNTMDINQKIPHTNISLFNISNYISFNLYIFTKYLPFALIPVAFLFFIPVFSFFHPRLQKNRSLIYSILLLALYLSISFANKTFSISLLIPLIFFILGVAAYKWKVNF